MRLIRSPSDSGLHLDSSQPPSSLRGDPLDFGIPLRFQDGAAKPEGSNYSYIIVVPKTKKEDLSWFEREIPEANLAVYEVDNPNAKYKVPKNKGREAMVCGAAANNIPSTRWKC